MSVGEFVSVNVRGLDQLEKNLLQLEEDIARRTLTRAAREAMDIYKEAAITNAPVRTGRLFQNILMGSSTRSDGVRGASVYVRVGLRTKPRERSVFYGKFIEFGWVSRGGRHIPARPWARPAFDQTKTQVLHRFGVILGEEIENAAKRAGLELV